MLNPSAGKLALAAEEFERRAAEISALRHTVSELKGALSDAEAERIALADVLRDMYFTHDDSMGKVEAALAVQEIIDSARAENRKKNPLA